MIFFPFLCSGIPDLALGILKMLIVYVFMMYHNQQSNNLILAWYDSQTLCTYLIIGSTNIVLHFSVKKKKSPQWSLARAKKCCNNINNSRAQVSRLCYFLWLCTNTPISSVRRISQDNFFPKLILEPSQSPISNLACIVRFQSNRISSLFAYPFSRFNLLL